MESEQPTRNKKLFVVVTIVLIILAASLFLFTKNAETPIPQPGAPSTVTAPPRVYTEAEKIDILKSIATQSSKDTTTQAQDIKTLQNLSKQAPKDNTSTEDKLKILQALSTQTN